ncbi:MAG: NAD(P)H-quinone oxidoreductase [Actinobacteria bacterium]|nr:NAD(P)H-quinone oxidoreductase [Actinomycetota bacterium]
MRAVVLTEFGEPEVLRVTDVPVPTPAADEVLVRVHATALNRADLLQRRGFYPNPFPTTYDIPGMEFAGEVVAAPANAAARASRFKPGDHVMGIVSGGAYAEYVTIPAAQAMRTPRGMSLADAAAIPEVFITAWDALVLQGGLKPGGTALVHAGASGVGTAAIQICRAMGARIIVTCSGARGGVDKVQACRDLGANLIIDYQSQDFAKEVADFTQGRGVDVVLDVIGGDYTVRNVACLALKGRMIQVGTMAGPSKDFNVASLMGKRASIIGTVLRPRPKEEKIAVSQAFAEALLPDFDAGVLKPIVDKRFTLDQIVEAHRHMEANANVGKIVVTIAA